jgi:hypothetical protein
MMNNIPTMIENVNLSYAWAELFLRIMRNPGTEVSNVMISLTGLSSGIDENSTIRAALDNCLASYPDQQVQTVANTIFPENLWKLSQCNRHILFNKYLSNLPRIKALKPTKNCRGLYFERLINFDSACDFSNQLEYIISTYNLRPAMRRSAFQASVFDPRRDHVKSPQLGFPCLQHLQFVPDNQEKLLSVNAFYATQQVFQKAYGNYLGICRLGQFMANQMNISLDRVNIFIGVAKVEKVKKTDQRILNLQEIMTKVLYSDQTLSEH